MGDFVIKSSYLTNARALAQGFATGALAKDRVSSQTLATLESGLKEDGEEELRSLVISYQEALAWGRFQTLEALGPIIAEKILKASERVDGILCHRFGLTRFASSQAVTASLSQRLNFFHTRPSATLYADGSIVHRTEPVPLSDAVAQDSLVEENTQEGDFLRRLYRSRSLRGISPATRERLYLQAKRELRRYEADLRAKGLSLSGLQVDVYPLLQQGDDPHPWVVLFQLKLLLENAHQNGLVAYVNPFQREPNLHLIFEGERYTPSPNSVYFFSKNDKKVLTFANPTDPKKIVMVSERYGRSDSYILFFKGEPFTWDGKGSFKNEWGDVLKTDSPEPIENAYRITVHPEVIPAHPQGLVAGNSVFYHGKKYTVRPFEERKNHYLLISSQSADPELLAVYDQETKKIRRAEGVFLYEKYSERFFSDSVFVDGCLYYVRSRKRVNNRIPYEGFSSLGGRVLLWKIGDGTFSKVPTDGTAVHPWGKTLFFENKNYRIRFQDGDIVYAVDNNDPEGFFASWFVGRRVLSEGGLWRVVPLQREELRKEFDRLLKRISQEWGARDLSFAKFPRPTTIAIQPTGQGTWRGKVKTESRNPITFLTYSIQIDGEHTIKLFLPAEGTDYIPSVWKRSLRQFPKKVLLGIKEIVVVPGKEKLVEHLEDSLAYFNVTGKRVVVREGQIGDNLLQTLYHEILGHGTERKNSLVHQLTVLAMKLDERMIDAYAMKNVMEYYARGAEILALYPQRHRDYPHLMRLIRRMADVTP